MAVIGATQLEPVNILGSYVQGLEMAKANKLAQQQQQRLMRQDEMAQQRFSAEMAATEAQSRKADLEAKLRGHQLIADFASAAVDEPSYQSVLRNLQDFGVDTSRLPQTYDPQFVAQQRRAALTEAQRIDAELKGRELGVRERTVGVQESQAQTAAEREARLARQPVGGAAVSGPPTKLKQGERWNPELQRVEAVPGSELFQKQKKVHGKDYDVVKSTAYEANLGRSKIDRLLDPTNEKEFKNLFGGYTAYATGRLSGKTATLRTELNSLKSNLKTAGKRIISAAGSGAIGQITEREWPILESMIGELVPEMDTPGARAKLEEIRAQLTKMEDLARESYDETWGESQYYTDIPRTGTGAPPAAKPTGGAGQIVDVSTVEEARKLAPGTRFRTPDGRIKVR